MSFSLSSLSTLAGLPFDQIIDVRAPSEFALDHLPGAINLPVLDDDERALIGTTYVQVSRFRARKLGAALVARNAARHLEGALTDKDGSYKPLVYCWRGGQRSNAFAVILAQIGWRVEVLEGGYKSYRRLVAQSLYDTEFPAPVVVLGGNTGTAKTDLLMRLKSMGVQVIDLEGLANHRGSLFGHRPGGQPSQKAFEGMLAGQIAALDPTKPVMVEAESSKIGRLNVPPSLWRVMLKAPRIVVQAPLKSRAQYLTAAYRDVIEDQPMLLKTIEKLRPLHSTDRINNWLLMAKDAAFEELASELMLCHYDPRYKKQGDTGTPTDETIFCLDDLSPTGLDSAAERLAKQVTGAI